MQLILKRIIIFSIPLIIILASLEYFTRQGNSLYKDKWSGLIKNADSIEILILGSSQAMNGLDPSKFDLYAYNMAFGQQSLYFDQAITIKNLDKLKNLKYIIINLSYDSFYSTHSEDRDIFYHYYYGIDYKNTKFYKEDISRLYAFGFKSAIRNHMMHPPYDATKGFFTYDSTNYSALNSQMAKQRIEEMIMEKNNKKEVLNDLAGFIETLKHRHIAPILITLPHHSYYNKELNKNILFENYKSIDSICNKFSIKYYNYINEPLPDSLFYNVDHLNKFGAKRISLQLNEIINAYEKLN